MTLLRIELTEQISDWIDAQIEAGAFTSQSEVVQQCVRTYIQDTDPRYFARPVQSSEATDLSLVDQIVTAVRNGEISEPFGFEQIFKRFGQQFSESNLRTCLANFAMDEVAGAKGWHVSNGRSARFLRVSRGQYKVLGSKLTRLGK